MTLLSSTLQSRTTAAREFSELRADSARPLVDGKQADSFEKQCWAVPQ